MLAYDVAACRPEVALGHRVRQGCGPGRWCSASAEDAVRLMGCYATSSAQVLCTKAANKHISFAEARALFPSVHCARGGHAGTQIEAKLVTYGPGQAAPSS